MRAVPKAQQKKNREALANFLDTKMTDKQFDMGAWTSEVNRNHCGTTGCALGWAAMSGIIPGLGWNYDPADKDLALEEREVLPVVNKKFVGWNEVGPAFFGYAAHDSVFTHASFCISLGGNSKNNRHVVAGYLRAIKD